jgi:hypothetical protein
MFFLFHFYPSDACACTFLHFVHHINDIMPMDAFTYMVKHFIEFYQIQHIYECVVCLYVHQLHRGIAAKMQLAKSFKILYIKCTFVCFVHRRENVRLCLLPYSSIWPSHQFYHQERSTPWIYICILFWDALCDMDEKTDEAAISNSSHDIVFLKNLCELANCCGHSN